MSFRFVAVLTAFVWTFLTSPLFAQAPPAPAPLPAAGWADGGFFLQAPNGDFRLALGMVAQTDGRFALDTPKPITNTFTIRKARPIFAGRVAKYFDFRVVPDFGNGTTVVQDAYFDVRFSPAFRVRSGKDKTPIGYELLIGDANLLFPERALASSLVPNRDVGIQVQGDLVGARFSYAAGVFNGVADGSSSSTDVDTNNAKDLAGRIVVQPFRTRTPDGALNGLGFQIGASHGQQAGALPSFRTSVGQTYYSYAAGAAASGDRTRLTPTVFYYYKSIGVFAEYFRSAQPITLAALQTDVVNQAWEISGSFLLTGEAASAGTTRPRNVFDPPNGKWGALQVVARYTELAVDRAAFTAGLAGAGASRVAESFTAGLNWYPAAYIKYYATFERTAFSGTRATENVILFRTQLAL